MTRRRFSPSLDGLEPRVTLSRIGVAPPPAETPISDPTVPVPPTTEPDDPPPPPEPSPGPFPGTDPPITPAPPPLGGPVGPA
jgi:hypothetical protein